MLSVFIGFTFCMGPCYTTIFLILHTNTRKKSIAGLNLTYADLIPSVDKIMEQLVNSNIGTRTPHLSFISLKGAVSRDF